MTTSDTMLRTTAAAGRIGIDVGTLKRLVADKQLRAFRIGRAGELRFRPCDIEDYLSRCDTLSGYTEREKAAALTAVRTRKRSYKADRLAAAE